MANLEKVEAVTSELAETLDKRLGQGTAQIIVAVLDKDGAYYVARRGIAPGVIYLLELTNRSIKDALLPKSTIST
jgi:hypothetical protein